MATAHVTALHHAATGIRGLDEILSGGFRRRRLYVVEGDAGTGKTTLGLQFLLAGLARGEGGLYVSLTDTQEDLQHAVTGVAEALCDEGDIDARAPTVL